MFDLIVQWPAGVLAEYACDDVDRALLFVIPRYAFVVRTTRNEAVAQCFLLDTTSPVRTNMRAQFTARLSKIIAHLARRNLAFNFEDKERTMIKSTTHEGGEGHVA